ncbi:hypothetical protein P692DRAFT_20864385 [Suillus brevipes Sb2]|nr:hypothetical protein P692DRAFT_20864385 [Suillus brevipes Sb2]
MVAPRSSNYQHELHLRSSPQNIVIRALRSALEPRMCGRLPEVDNANSGTLRTDSFAGDLLVFKTWLLELYRIRSISSALSFRTPYLEVRPMNRGRQRKWWHVARRTIPSRETVGSSILFSSIAAWAVLSALQNKLSWLSAQSVYLSWVPRRSSFSSIPDLDYSSSAAVIYALIVQIQSTVRSAAKDT